MTWTLNIIYRELDYLELELFYRKMVIKVSLQKTKTGFVSELFRAFSTLFVVIKFHLSKGTFLFYVFLVNQNVFLIIHWSMYMYLISGIFVEGIFLWWAAN
jgi:hypothetical protein